MPRSGGLRVWCRGAVPERALHLFALGTFEFRGLGFRVWTLETFRLRFRVEMGGGALSSPVCRWDFRVGKAWVGRI